MRDCGLEIRAVGETEWESRCETEVTLAATETIGSVVVMDSAYACTVCIIEQNESEVWECTEIPKIRSAALKVFFCNICNRKNTPKPAFVTVFRKNKY